MASSKRTCEECATLWRESATEGCIGGTYKDRDEGGDMYLCCVCWARRWGLSRAKIATNDDMCKNCQKAITEGYDNMKAKFAGGDPTHTPLSVKDLDDAVAARAAAVGKA